MGKDRVKTIVKVALNQDETLPENEIYKRVAIEILSSEIYKNISSRFVEKIIRKNDKGCSICPYY